MVLPKNTPVLQPQDVDELCLMYEAGFSYLELTRLFSISRATVQYWIRRKGITPRAQGTIRIRGQRFSHTVHEFVNKEVAAGYLQRGSCAICALDGTLPSGRPAVEAHHLNYNQPFVVQWLCHRHHQEWHENNVAIPLTEENQTDLRSFLRRERDAFRLLQGARTVEPSSNDLDSGDQSDGPSGSASGDTIPPA
jgi:hypothetical protein